MHAIPNVLMPFCLEIRWLRHPDVRLNCSGESSAIFFSAWNLKRNQKKQTPSFSFCFFSPKQSFNNNKRIVFSPGYSGGCQVYVSWGDQGHMKMNLLEGWGVALWSGPPHRPIKSRLLHQQ